MGEDGEAGKFFFDVGVMGGDDVVAEDFERRVGPVGGEGSGAFRGEFEGGEDRVYFEVACDASFVEGFATAAAIIYAKTFEYADGCRLFQSYFADGLCGGGHCDLLDPNSRRWGRRVAATFVTRLEF